MSRKIAGVILAALGLVVAACSTAPKNQAATDPQMSGRDQRYCKTHGDTLECRQNTNNY